jgi:hypothetical protein
MQPTLRHLLRHLLRQTLLRLSGPILAVAGACILPFAALSNLTLDASSAASTGQSVALRGVFKLTPGQCNPAMTQVSGSYSG